MNLQQVSGPLQFMFMGETLLVILSKSEGTREEIRREEVSVIFLNLLN